MRHNYYETQTKHHLAQSILLMVCNALTKAAKLGKDGLELFDSLQITMIEAVGKRNVLMEELEHQELGTMDSLKAAIQKSSEERQRLLDEREAMENQLLWDKQQEAKAKAADISKAGDPNEVW